MNNRFYIQYSFFTCFAVLLLFSQSACNKKLSKYNPDFIGTWRTAVIEDSTINLTVRSEIVIEKRDGLFNNTCTDECGERLCECISQQGGRAVVNTDRTRLKIDDFCLLQPKYKLFLRPCFLLPQLMRQELFPHLEYRRQLTRAGLANLCWVLLSRLNYLCQLNFRYSE